MKNSLPLILVFLVFLACVKDRRENIPTTARKDQIQQLIKHCHDTGSFDGTVLIAESGEIVFEGVFGLANRKNNVPLTVGSQFYLASVSKQFTATAILLLVQQGEITLDEKVIKFIPELPELYMDITFRHLLSHTSGIPDYYEIYDPEPGFTNRDVLDLLKKVDSLEFNPGDCYHYSNSGYVLLSILVNRVTGITFSEYLRENAFAKAGLHHTIIFDEHAPAVNNRAFGYGRDGSLTDYRFRTTGGGGIFSTVKDLYRWHKALSEYKILTKDIQEQAYQPTQLNNDSTVYYGFGWRIDADDPNHVYHEGELEGFRTFFDRYTDEEKVIILLSNNSSEILPEISEKIYEVLK